MTLNDMLDLATSESEEVIILGDDNVNFMVRSDNKAFKELLALYGFQQLIKQPNRL